MSVRLLEGLTELRNALIEKTQELKNTNVDAIELINARFNVPEKNQNKAQNDIENIINIIINYESKLKELIVSLNNEYRGFKINWQKSMTYDYPDELTIVQFNEEYMTGKTKLELQNIIDNLVCNVDWFSEYKKDFKETIKQMNDKNASEIDEKRERIIKSHLIESQNDNLTNNEVNDANTDSRAKMSWTFEDKGVTSKSKLLNTTKKLTNNLIKGNQILQSSVLQSDLNLDELRQQTSSMQIMNDKYLQFEIVFNKTSQLVRRLEKASQQEKRDVYLSLGFLAMCIFWILWRRVFKVPVKIGLWIVFKFFKYILVSIGFVKKVSNTINSDIISDEIINTIASTIVSTTVSNITGTISSDIENNIEQVVDAAMDRILAHDEL
ncbi:hypothetical protein TPHA_0P01100 [Tetrapisispora phaffii CBS 4417]|uniref:Sec20 C-terminal domain-containing protein n=1 Tax=Tetrapisispora phaffii (strain ATCC 24235 / CBS 4417 / NBRC 1672 / NRRL Y-8282 / UCD 70-5) TaxID=1071381 RepID=G8C290_TETPH|nr:hypothetical protein TPHA_0P01100 [Tetrapisispora phaffii CBS 4417]CCE66268.1 hypothetical protein TPHA_0P01100 [Tetrapisispora phaffii CBS 4417]